MNSYNECKAIFELDLDPIKVKLMHKESGEGWTLEQASAVEFEYRRFLYLMKMYPHEQTAPLADVDTFWHYHILDTVKYAADCEAVFGYFLHHFPYIGLRGEADEEAHHRVGERMRELYEQTFGESYDRQDYSGTTVFADAISQTAWSGATGMPASPALASGATTQTAWSGAIGKPLASDATAKTAWSGAIGKPLASDATAKTAWSGAIGKPLASGATAQTAWSGAIGKPLASGATAKTAWSGATGKPLASGATAQTAWSGAIGKPLASGATAKTAWSGATGQPLASGATAKTAWSGATGKPLASGATAKTAWSGATGKPAHAGSAANTAWSGATGVEADTSKRPLRIDSFYTARPTLAAV